MPKRTTHFSRHFFVFIIFVLVMGFSTGCSSPEEKKAKHFKRGVEYAEKNKLKSAAIEFKNVIQIDPKYGPGHYQLALVDIKLGRFREALSELRKTVDVDPKNRDARIKLVQFLILAKQNEEAQKHIAYLLKNDPDDVEVLVLKSNLDIKNGKLDEAIAVLGKALKKDPQNRNIYLTLANAYTTKKEFAKAESAIQKAIATSKTPREKMQARLMLAGFYESNLKKPEKAQAVLIQTERDNPKELSPALALIKFYLRNQKTDAARAELDKAIKTFPKNALLLVMKADLELRDNKLDQAEKLLTAALKLAPDNQDVTAKLALLKLNLNKTDEAKKLSEKCLSKNPGQPVALLVKGRLALMDKDFDQAIKCFNKVLEKASKDPQTLYFRALAYLGKGKIKDAEDDLVTCTVQAPNFLKARLLLADIYLRERKADDSIYQTEYILKRAKDEPLALTMHASALMLKKDFPGAIKDIQKVLAQQPDNIGAKFLLARAKLAMGEKDSAEALLKEIIQKKPGYLPAFTTLVAIYMKGKSPDKALKLCQDMEAKAPKNAAIPMVQGRVLLALGKFQEAEKAFKKAMSLNENLVAPYVALAKIYVATGKADQAIREYRKLLEKNPNLVMAYMAIGSIEQKLGHMDKAEAAYREALKAKPDFAPAANNLAWLLAENNKLEEAFIYIQKAKEAAPEQPSILDTSGWILAKKGNYQLAVADLSEALKKWPNQPTINYHMAVALKGLGKKEEARQHLTTALDAKAPFPERKEAEALLKEL